MDIDQQIQALIDAAPQDGTTPGVVKAIAPALLSLTSQLKHPQYYILQTPDQRWVMTTLSHRLQPDREKRVVYAFPTLEDASTGSYASNNSQVTAVIVAVTHILFQMVAMQSIDSTIFFETPGDLTNGTEVSRENLDHLIRLYLQKQQAESKLPPDIA
jgi:hypothetical protein